MSFELFPGVGMVHLQTVNKPRVVPGAERHRWGNKHLLRRQSTSCEKCGCVKTYRADYEVRYRMPGERETTERPACTGDSSSTA